MRFRRMRARPSAALLSLALVSAFVVVVAAAVDNSAITCYADALHGTDAPHCGTAPGASACATLQSGVDCVVRAGATRASSDGVATLYVAPGTYGCQGRAYAVAIAQGPSPTPYPPPAAGTGVYVNVSLQIVGTGGAAVTVIDCSAAGRELFAALWYDTVPLRLQGVTVQNGDTTYTGGLPSPLYAQPTNAVVYNSWNASLAPALSGADTFVVRDVVVQRCTTLAAALLIALSDWMTAQSAAWVPTPADVPVQLTLTATRVHVDGCTFCDNTLWVSALATIPGLDAPAAPAPHRSSARQQQQHQQQQHQQRQKPQQQTRRQSDAAIGATPFPPPTGNASYPFGAAGLSIQLNSGVSVTNLSLRVTNCTFERNSAQIEAFAVLFPADRFGAAATIVFASVCGFGEAGGLASPWGVDCGDFQGNEFRFADIVLRNNTQLAVENTATGVFVALSGWANVIGNGFDFAGVDADASAAFANWTAGPATVFFNNESPYALPPSPAVYLYVANGVWGPIATVADTNNPVLLQTRVTVSASRFVGAGFYWKHKANGPVACLGNTFEFAGTADAPLVFANASVVLQALNANPQVDSVQGGGFGVPSMGLTVTGPGVRFVGPTTGFAAFIDWGYPKAVNYGTADAPYWQQPDSFLRVTDADFDGGGWVLNPRMAQSLVDSQAYPVLVQGIMLGGWWDGIHFTFERVAWRDYVGSWNPVLFITDPIVNITVRDCAFVNNQFAIPLLGQINAGAMSLSVLGHVVVERTHFERNAAVLGVGAVVVSTSGLDVHVLSRPPPYNTNPVFRDCTFVRNGQLNAGLSTFAPATGAGLGAESVLAQFPLPLNFTNCTFQSDGVRTTTTPGGAATSLLSTGASFHLRNTTLACPAGQDVYVGPGDSNAGCRSCPIGRYAITPGAPVALDSAVLPTTCLACPFGGNCSSGGNVIGSAASYWGAVVAVDDTDPSLRTVEFSLCPTGFCASGDDAQSWTQFDSCSGNRAGVLCGRCADGFSAQFGTTDCRESSSCTDAGWFIPVSFLLGGALALTYFFGAPAGSGDTQVVTYFFQLITLALVVSPATSSSGDSAALRIQSLIAGWFQLRIGGHRSSGSSGGSSSSSGLNSTGVDLGACPWPMTNLQNEQWTFAIPLLLFVPLLVIAAAVTVKQRYFRSRQWSFPGDPSRNATLINGTPRALNRLFVVSSGADVVVHHSQQQALLPADFKEFVSPKAAAATAALVSPLGSSRAGGGGASALDSVKSGESLVAADVDHRTFTPSTRLAAAALQSVLFLYSSVLMASFTLLYCVPIRFLDPSTGAMHTSQRLFVDGTVACYQPWQVGVIVVAFACAVFPVALFVYTRRLHTTHHSAQALTARQRVLYAVLCGPYTERCYYFDSVLMAHRLLVIGVWSAVRDPVSRVLAVACITVAALCIHIIARPFRVVSVGWLQTLCLSATIVVCGFSLPPAALVSYAAPVDSAASGGLSTLLVLQTAVLLLVLIVGGLLVVKRRWTTCVHVVTCVSCRASRADEAPDAVDDDLLAATPDSRP